MSGRRKILIIILSYLLVFAATLVICWFAMNSGTLSGRLQDNSATLPLIYVRSGGNLINEMHGFKENVDAGYYRDSITPLDESKAVNLVISEYEYRVSSVSFELYNDANTELIEEGSAGDLENNASFRECQIPFREELKSNCEYCLRIMLFCEGAEQPLNYYTRIRYGSDLKVAEKLKFVLDFNEASFSKESAYLMESYLEPSGISGNDFSHVDIHSSVSEVSWGDLSPGRTSDIFIKLREINTETASFSLSYSVESSAEEKGASFDVEEYYRIRIGDDKIYMLDFEREMKEKLTAGDTAVNEGRIKLGIGDGSETSLLNYGSDEHSYSCLCDGQMLWLYDSESNILTDVYSDRDLSHKCAHQEDWAIKVVSTDSETGDLYFIVYGYMHSGRYEGNEGVLLYRFTYAEDVLEELLFIPYEKGFLQLSDGLSALAYMSSDGIIYFMIETTIYSYNLSNGHLEIAWDNVDYNSCAVSDRGVMAIVQDQMENSGAGESLSIIDLNSGKERKIDSGVMLITPMGFVGSDLVYGDVSRDDVAMDSSGIVRIPVSTVHIVNEELKEVKTYQKTGSYIMRSSISGNMISFYLGRAKLVDGYTDYEDAGEDHIIYNAKAQESDITIETQKGSAFGSRYYLKLKENSSLVPVVQKARRMDPGYDISKETESSGQLPTDFYVYTRGKQAVEFATMKEAIDYGNEYAGTIMTSHKKVAWQRAGRAYIWDLGIEKTEKAEKGKQNKAVLRAIGAYEGWDVDLGKVSDERQLFAIMSERLPAQTINLSGIDLTDVLHFVYRDRLVVAKTGGEKYCLIVGYSTENISIADLEKGEVSRMSWESAQQLFDAGGRVYYSYFD